MTSLVLINLFLLLITLSIAVYLVKNQERFQQRSVLPVYIISLPRRNQRLASLLQRMKPSTDYHIRHVYAVNGKEFIEGFEEPLRAGQIGCWLSHITMWEMIAKQSEPYALVLEDDADIQLPQQMERIQNEIANLPSDWKILLLGGHVVSPDRQLKITDTIVKPNGTTYHTHAYIIKQSVAQDLARRTQQFKDQHNRRDWKMLPIDDWLSEPSTGLLDGFYVIQPNLVSFIADSVSDTNE